MARSNRRDCRTVHRKKNAMKYRVEAQHKLIRKGKKDGTTTVANGPGADASETATELTATAADFLTQMRSDALAATQKLRQDVKSRAST